MPIDLHDVVAARLATVPQRYTRGRHGLVELMVSAGRPLSISEVLAAWPGASQSSIYRNLTVLEEAGVVRRLFVAGEFAHFELAEELTEHHHHLICTACGTVLDVTLDKRSERSIERIAERAAVGGGFRMTGHRLDVLGICGRCESS